MDDGGLLDQLAFVFQTLDDGFVGVFAELAFVVWDGAGELAFVVEGVNEVDVGGGEQRSRPRRRPGLGGRCRCRRR